MNLHLLLNRRYDAANIQSVKVTKALGVERQMLKSMRSPVSVGTPALRAVVLHGAGRAFSAGLDMASFAAMAEGESDRLLADLPARTHGIANLAQQAAFVWRALAVPVMALGRQNYAHVPRHMSAAERHFDCQPFLHAPPVNRLLGCALCGARLQP